MRRLYNMKKIKRSGRGYVIAEGEATGHAHTIADEVELYQDGDVKKLKMDKPVTVRHEEHDAQVINIPKKDYITIDTVIETNHEDNTNAKVKD